MFRLMRKSTHERLIKEAVDRALQSGYGVGMWLGKLKAQEMDGTDLAMKQIEATAQSKGVIIDHEDWHEQNDDRESERD